MARPIDPKETTRAMAFELWMKAPNPMVTFFKTVDVTNLVRVSRLRGLKFNMLLDYCIGAAAAPFPPWSISSGSMSWAAGSSPWALTPTIPGVPDSMPMK